jgi:hypothetical protein
MQTTLITLFEYGLELGMYKPACLSIAERALSEFMGEFKSDKAVYEIAYFEFRNTLTSELSHIKATNFLQKRNELLGSSVDELA